MEKVWEIETTSFKNDIKPTFTLTSVIFMIFVQAKAALLVFADYSMTWNRIIITYNSYNYNNCN